MHETLTNVIALNIIRHRGVYSNVGNHGLEFSTWRTRMRSNNISLFTALRTTASAHGNFDCMYANSVRHLVTDQTDQHGIKPEIVFINVETCCHTLSTLTIYVWFGIQARFGF